MCFFFRGWGAVGLGAQGHFSYIVTLVTLFNQHGPDNSQCGSRHLVFSMISFWVWRTIHVLFSFFQYPVEKLFVNWLTWKVTRGVTSCRPCSLDKLPCHDQFSANRNPIPYNVIFQFYMSSFRYTSPPPKNGRTSKRNELKWEVCMMTMIYKDFGFTYHNLHFCLENKQNYLPSHLDTLDMSSSNSTGPQPGPSILVPPQKNLHPLKVSPFSSPQKTRG